MENIFTALLNSLLEPLNFRRPLAPPELWSFMNISNTCLIDVKRVEEDNIEICEQRENIPTIQIEQMSCDKATHLIMSG